MHFTKVLLFFWYHGWAWQSFKGAPLDVLYIGFVVVFALGQAQQLFKGVT